MINIGDLVGKVEDTGEYKLDSFIGFGGHSVVYKASKSGRSEPVAIKFVEIGFSLEGLCDLKEQPTHSPQQGIRYRHEKDATHVAGSENDEILQMILNERRILEHIGKHPNIAGLDGYGEIIIPMNRTDGEEQEAILLYNVYPYVNAFDCDYLTTRKLPIPRIVDIVLSVAKAAVYIHSKKVIHKDIKPGNILVDRNTYETRLTDFGIAFYVPDDDEGKYGTRATPGYAGPEQWLGNSYYKSDVFALGATLFHMLTGEFAVELGDEDIDTALKTVKREIRADSYPLRKKRPDAPEELLEAREKMMEYGLRDRIEMGEVVDRFKRIKDKLAA